MKVIKAVVEFNIRIDEWAYEDPEYQTPDDYMSIVEDALRETDPMDYQNSFYDAMSRIKILSLEEVKTDERSSIQSN